ncbi:glycine amidinotransferase [Streptomyces sp. NPDC001549]|uniref:glycine amidinotransferase n=1 Tax=Streptomyces sp. NPDC001549 TaxID=3364586 RepID=UPI0036C4BE2C
MNQPVQRANSFDEWSPLREVIVGSGLAYEAHDVDLSFKLFFHDVVHSSFYYPAYGTATADAAPSRRALNRRYVEELNEDLEGFAAALTAAGVVVHRPVALREPVEFRTPAWQASMIPALNVRDQAIVLGDEILETAPQVRARLCENDLLKRLFYDYFAAGSRWATMPRPIMTDRSFDTSYVSGKNTPAMQDVSHITDSEFDCGFEMMIDAAQCVRLGRDIIVNVANANHRLAATWLGRHLGDRFRIHTLHRFADNHIDSLVLPLRPGLLLLRNPGVAKSLPKPLRDWDHLYAPEPSDRVDSSYADDDLLVASPYIDMNVLSLDENTVVANSLFPELITVLERAGFTVIPVRHRHRRLFGGGFHCFTLDTVRAGGQEDYFGSVSWTRD